MQQTTQSSSSGRRKLLNLIGMLLAVLAVGLVFYQLGKDNRYIAVGQSLGAQVPQLLALSAGYALLNILLCLGWAQLCRACGTSLSLVEGGLLYARTHIYRYLPSNVLHFVGRQAALGAANVAQTTALAINSLEVGLLLVAAALLTAAFWWFAPTLPWSLNLIESQPVLMAMPILALLAAIVLIAVLNRRKLTAWSDLLLCNTIYLVFFVGSAALLYALALLITGPAGSADSVTVSSGMDAFATIALVATVAWFGGAVVPGASAGIGIREALIVSGLTPLMGATNALTLALGFRLITVGGDLWLTAGAWLRSSSGYAVSSADKPAAKD